MTSLCAAWLARGTSPSLLLLLLTMVVTTLMHEWAPVEYASRLFNRARRLAKIALAGLVAFCRAQGIAMIDCQQNTAHLASLGAAEIARADFVDQIKQNARKPSPVWIFDTLYWQQILKPQT